MTWSPVVILATLGLLLLACVPFVMTGVLEVMLAVSLSTLTTALLVQLGVLSGNWPLLLTVIAGLTLLYAVVIWKPMRALLKRPAGSDNVSDFVGMSLQLPADFDAHHHPYLHYSGIRWQVRAESASALVPQQWVIVTRVEVGALSVRPADRTSTS